MRLRLIPEGVLSAQGHGYTPDALTWRTGPIPIVSAGRTIGAFSDLAREDVDGVTWITARNVVLDEQLPSITFSVVTTDDVERFEVSGPDAGRWVEEAQIRRMELADTPTFEGSGIVIPLPSPLAAEAEAVLAAVAVDEMPDMITDMGMRAFEGVLAIEGEPTGDGRMLDTGSIFWEDSQAPWPLKFDRDEGDHTAAIVGSITRLWRDGSNIMGEGFLHTDTADPETAALVLRTIELLETDGGATPGISIELDSESVDVRVDKEAWEEWQKEMEDWLDEEVPEADNPEVDADGRVTMDSFRFDDWLYVTTEARFRGAAIVDSPAFAEARIAMVASGREVPRIWLTGDTVLAHAAAAVVDFDAPPRDWFEMAEPDTSDPRVVWVDNNGVPVDPDTPGARAWGIPLTITTDGQVYGHLASWQDCHTGFTDRCLTPPRSASDYAWFHTGVTRTTGGDIPTGRITTDTDHAPRRATAASAVGHYDQTGHAVADVAATNGAMGPWLSGWVRPWATAQQKHELMAHPPSGDWRPRGGSTELIGVLCVNVPGFPLPRSVATYRAGEFVSLVASGFAPVSPERIASHGPLADRLAILEARLDADAVLRSLESA